MKNKALFQDTAEMIVKICRNLTSSGESATIEEAAESTASLILGCF